MLTHSNVISIFQTGVSFMHVLNGLLLSAVGSMHLLVITAELQYGASRLELYRYEMHNFGCVQFGAFTCCG